MYDLVNLGPAVHVDNVLLARSTAHEGLAAYDGDASSLLQELTRPLICFFTTSLVPFSVPRLGARHFPFSFQFNLCVMNFSLLGNRKKLNECSFYDVVYLFISMQQSTHKLHHLLPPLWETPYTTRNTRTYCVPRCRTARFHNSFIPYALNTLAVIKNSFIN